MARMITQTDTFGWIKNHYDEKLHKQFDMNAKERATKRMQSFDEFTSGLDVDISTSGYDIFTPNSSVAERYNNESIHNLTDIGMQKPKMGLTEPVKSVPVKPSEVTMPDFYNDFESNYDSRAEAKSKEMQAAHYRKPVAMETCDKCGTRHNANRPCECQRIANEREREQHRVPVEIFTLIIAAAALTLIFILK